jgi:tyrosyl-tRNA synthetase
MKPMDISSALKTLLAGTEKVISADELKKKLEAGRPLRVKLGFDPSSPDLHLGHVVVLDKIRQFQDLGHTAVIIIGDFTARIGDPTGRSKTRPALDAATVKKNAETYTDQVFKVLDRTRTEIRFNGEWFDAFTYADVLRLNSQMTVAQLLERDDFKKRYTEGQSITLTEFQYPLVQGYDSVMVRSDVELGGNDQLFNNLVGRDLQKAAGQEPQVVMVLPILEGTDGVQKMGKSLGNYVGINEPAPEIFGKVMSISDELMARWRGLIGPFYGLGARAPEHPMEAKKQLAEAVAARFHGAEAGRQARADFEQKFSKRDLSAADIPEKKVGENPIWIVKLLQDIGAASSGSDARRLIQQGAVSLDGAKVTDVQAKIDCSRRPVLQSGKKFFARLTL